MGEYRKEIQTILSILRNKAWKEVEIRGKQRTFGFRNYVVTYGKHMMVTYCNIPNIEIKI